MIGFISTLRRRLRGVQTLGSQTHVTQMHGGKVALVALLAGVINVFSMTCVQADQLSVQAGLQTSVEAGDRVIQTAPAVIARQSTHYRVGGAHFIVEHSATVVQLAGTRSSYHLQAPVPVHAGSRWVWKQIDDTVVVIGRRVTTPRLPIAANGVLRVFQQVTITLPRHRYSHGFDVKALEAELKRLGISAPGKPSIPAPKPAPAASGA